MSQMLLLLTTVSNEKEAQALAERLIDERLAACVQYTSGRSCYRWQGLVRHESECMLSIKTRRELLPEIEALMDAHHPYELPEMIALDADAGAFYGRWLRGELRSATHPSRN